MALPTKVTTPGHAQNPSKHADTKASELKLQSAKDILQKTPIRKSNRLTSLFKNRTKELLKARKSSMI
jgi:hypothetical protein